MSNFWMQDNHGLAVDYNEIFSEGPSEYKKAFTERLKKSNKEVISDALSNICRYTGNVNTFYSVAEHSVRVALYAAKLVAVRYPNALSAPCWKDEFEPVESPSPRQMVRRENTSGRHFSDARLNLQRQAALFGLIHDVHEMWTGDINNPLKQYLSRDNDIIKRLESNFDKIVYEVFEATFKPSKPTNGVGSVDITVKSQRWEYEEAKRLVKEADLAACVAEATQLMSTPPPRAWFESGVTPTLGIGFAQGALGWPPSIAAQVWDDAYTLIEQRLDFVNLVQQLVYAADRATKKIEQLSFQVLAEYDEQVKGVLR